MTMPLDGPTVDITSAPPVEETPLFDPALLAAVTAIAKAALSEAVASTPVPSWRPGTVQGVNPANRTTSVLVDGDDIAITVQTLDELPGLFDRVTVLFVPPGAAFLAGNQSGGGVPAGFVMAYAGPVTNHQGATVGSATLGMPPRGWLWCAGQAVSRSTYAALFAAIGTAYGVGDGSQTFNVPDFRGRIPLGMDNMGGSDASRLSSSNTLGTTGGAETHSGLPAHTHSTPNHSHAAGTLAVSSHTHDLASHTHTVNSHDHSTPNHSHSAQVVTGGAGVTGGADFTAPNTWGGVTNTDGGGTSGSSSPGTGSPSNNTSGSASPSLSGSTANDGSGTSGSAGAGSTVDHMPPFVTIHYLIKAA